MDKESRIQIPKKLRDEIIKVITARKEVEKIVVFGSRAFGSSRKTSDIDIAIFGKAWTDKDLNIIRHELNELIKTPLKIDILNFYEVTKQRLKSDILKGEAIYESRKD